MYTNFKKPKGIVMPFLISLLFFNTHTLPGQNNVPDINTCYQLSNYWMGEARSLSFRVDDNRIRMAQTDKSDDKQKWRFEPFGDDLYRICPCNGKDIAIDIIEKRHFEMELKEFNDSPSQIWILESIKDHFRIINMEIEDQAIDCDSDKKGTFAFVAPIGNYAGQFWLLNEAKESTVAEQMPEHEPTHESAAWTDAEIQKLLDSGDESPRSFNEKGLSVERLYGKTYKGGLIFYVDENNGSGLVASSEDILVVREWGCRGKDISGLTNVTTHSTNAMDEGVAKVGEGKKSTHYLLSNCTEDNTAAKLSSTKGEDWHLPSRGELNLMWKNLADSDGDGLSTGPKDPNNLGGFASGFFWSSTEANHLDAWYQDFSNGKQYYDLKDTGFMHVRAAKAFNN